MKIVLDARKLGDGGIGIYIQNLVDGFVDLIHEGVDLELTLLVEPARISELGRSLQATPVSSSLLGATDSSHSGVSSIPQATDAIPGRSDAGELICRMQRWSEVVRFVPEASGKYSLSEYFGLARRHRELLRSADLFHSPHYTLPFRLGIPSVITVHDVIHISQPETRYHAPIARRLIRSAVNRAAHVITVSGGSLARLTRLVSCPRAPVTVIPNALREGITEVASPALVSELLRLGRFRPYSVFVGSDRAHKNFDSLARAWKLLNNRLRTEGLEEVQLVAVGSRFSFRTRQFVKDLGLDDLVVFTDDLSLADLNTLYQGAYSVVVPSIEEGFGLVALEGLAAGVPVVCTPEISLKEVCENCAWYSEDASPRALADAIYCALTESELAEARALEGMERARLFSRELVARMTYAVYEDVLAGGVLEYVPHDQISNHFEFTGGQIYSEHLRRAV